MSSVHEFLNDTAFDLYELHLFHLVAKHGSFTKAAAAVGLTQSAITRQVQALERTLSVTLFERTTRQVRLTEAGQFLQREASRLLGDAEQSVRRLREEFSQAKKEVRVGVSRSIALAHLPGFFHANIRHAPQIGHRVSYATSRDIIDGLETSELDVGVLCAPERLPRTLQITHRFEDVFTLIAPAELARRFPGRSAPGAALTEWMEAQNWLFCDARTNTGLRLGRWIQQQGWQLEPSMQLEAFDLIINLVALGMGVAFVPIRALALYPRKRNLQRLPLPARFARTLVVLTRRRKDHPQHVLDFISRVLF